MIYYRSLSRRVSVNPVWNVYIERSRNTLRKSSNNFIIEFLQNFSKKSSTNIFRNSTKSFSRSFSKTFFRTFYKNFSGTSSVIPLDIYPRIFLKKSRNSTGIHGVSSTFSLELKEGILQKPFHAFFSEVHLKISLKNPTKILSDIIPKLLPTVSWEIPKIPRIILFKYRSSGSAKKNLLRFPHRFLQNVFQILLQGYSSGNFIENCTKILEGFSKEYFMDF